MKQWMLYMLLSNIILFLILAAFFFPKKRVPIVKRFLDFKMYVAIIIAVTVFQIIEVNLIDDFATQLIGKDFASIFYSYEKPLFELINNNLNHVALLMAVFLYIVFYPFTLWFTPLLFIVNGEEKSIKALSYGLLTIYLFALPFYLFFPVTNVYTHLHLDFHLDRFISGIDDFFYTVTTKNNCFPSLHVAVSLLLAKSSTFMKNKKYSYLMIIQAAGILFSVLYLSIHWFTDVCGGLIAAALAFKVIDHECSIEKKVLKKITPSIEERRRLNSTVIDLIKKIREELDRENIKATPKLVGSVAKDTYLRDSIDIDIFLLFPPNTPREEMEKKGLLVGRKILKDPEERYAEHPYIRGKFNGYDVEIVPCYRVKKASEKISAVDRTPFHTDFIKKNLPPRKRKDVRLLKRFLKGIGCYGAEAQVEGFSGYLCELLVLKYGSFKNVLKNAANWKKGEVIKLKDVSSPSFKDPLVFIDPVDPNRNVASALSEEKLNIFKRACREYLKKPSEKFFFPNPVKPLPDDEIRRHIQGFVGVEIDKPDIIPDNLYPQVKKSLRRIVNACEEKGFMIEKGLFTITDSKVYIFLKPKELELSPTYTHRGPPVDEKEHVESFLKKWKNSELAVGEPYCKDGRWYVEVKRKYRKLENFLAENLPKISLGKDIENVVKEGGYRVLTSKDLLTDDLKLFWSEYIDGKMPWER